MATYELIERIEVDPAVASVTFTDGGAWSGYTDLLIKLSARTTDTGTAELLRVQFNSSTSNYSARQIFGGGSGAPSYNTYASAFNAICIASVQGDAPTANTFGSGDIYIPNFASSNYKSLSADIVVENNATPVATGITAGLWSDTAAITSITLIGQTGTTTFKVGSTFTLYGIRKHNTASAPKATGGIITYDATNNKWVHTFTASGTFTPTENLTAEYLVIAGGGGGGGNQGGGGGAGGYRSSVSGELSGRGASAESPLSLTASTGYTVTVGAGGVGPNGPSNGAVGNNSVFASITSDGGGYGATYTTPGGTSTGGNGGSGGGAGAGADAKTHPGGSGTAGQGYDGGNSPGSSGDHRAGGGGGAGQAGGDGAGGSNVWIGGDGGDGIASSITGTSIIRAGGGGGAVEYTSDFAGAGGAGGGGAGGEGSALLPESGLPATGGGGGGCGTPGGGQAGSGGSGVVIVRYAA